MSVRKRGHFHGAKTDLFALRLLGEIVFFFFPGLGLFGFRFVCLVVLLVLSVSVRWQLWFPSGFLQHWSLGEPPLRTEGAEDHPRAPQHAAAALPRLGLRWGTLCPGSSWTREVRCRPCPRVGWARGTLAAHRLPLTSSLGGEVRRGGPCPMERVPVGRPLLLPPCWGRGSAELPLAAGGFQGPGEQGCY